MKVLVAGATGALGSHVTRELVAHGHNVVCLTRSRDKTAAIDALGAEPVFGDVFDAAGMKEVFNDARPEGICQLLNALPKRGPARPSELETTNRLRIEGTRNLLRAAIDTGVKRYVAESMIFGYGYGDAGGRKITEEDPFPRRLDFPAVKPALDALGSLEDQLLAATRAGEVEGIVLRLGLFYGPGVGSTEFMAKLLKRRMFPLPGGGKAVGSWIHIQDGASAVVAALERAPAGAVYNVVDDEPVELAAYLHTLAAAVGAPAPFSIPMWMARLVGGRYAALMARTKLPVSNEKIKRELGWRPQYPTYREGLASLAVAE